MSFERLRALLIDIMSGDSDVSLEDFTERVYKAWQEGQLTGSEYDWLNNTAEVHFG